MDDERESYRVDAPDTSNTKRNAALSRDLAANRKHVESIEWDDEEKQWVVYLKGRE